MRIASWNIAGGRKVKALDKFEYEKENVGYFVDELVKISPDTVCIQENHSDTAMSVAAEIAKGLSMTYIFDSPMSLSHVDPNFALGLAIISKSPLKEEKLVTYPYPDFPLYLRDGRKAVRHDKGFQLVKLNDFNLANTQLLPLGVFGHSYQEGEGALLARKVNKSLEILEKPLLFCGDFNLDNPLELLENLRDKLGLREALPDKLTRPNKLDKKLTPDHIFYSPEFKVLGSGVVQTETDHYLCWADLVLA